MKRLIAAAALTIAAIGLAPAANAQTPPEDEAAWEFVAYLYRHGVDVLEYPHEEMVVAGLKACAMLPNHDTDAIINRIVVGPYSFPSNRADGRQVVAAATDTPFCSVMVG
jgi:hypothetical protein